MFINIIIALFKGFLNDKNMEEMDINLHKNLIKTKISLEIL